MSATRPIAKVRRVLGSALCSCCLLLASAAASANSPHVLVLYANSRLLPANVQIDDGLRETLPAAADLSAEFLDAPRFSGESFADTFKAFLREKYGPRPPDAIVAAGSEALLFLLSNRKDLFGSVPIVHLGVFESYFRSGKPLPSDVGGEAMKVDFAGTIDLALRLRPSARRLVLVTGVAPLDKQFEEQLRADASRFQDRATLEFLAGLPTGDVLKRLSELGNDAVVVTPGYFMDGAGREFTPREAVEGMVGAAVVPVLGPFGTFMDSGVVGGSMVDFREGGRQAGRAVGQLIAGMPLAALKLPYAMPTHLEIDWRQIGRWGMDPDAIPNGAIVRFKRLTFLEQYRNEAIAAAAVFLLQTVLIAGLLAERRRRRRLELASQRQRAELAHASRLAVAGELAGAIAHEINQPLGAILSNTDAAELLLKSGADRPEELRAILADIRNDDLRASEVIRRLRALIAKQAVEWQPFDLDEAVADVKPLLRAEARRRRVTLDFGPVPSAARLMGDRIQVQQVIFNLVLNAMDAVADLPDDRRTIQVSVARETGAAVLTVSDHGHGIDPGHLPKLFDSFFSTKRRGMGLGLSIARTIVESHGGRIWAENSSSGGASFHVAMPLAPIAEQQTPVSP